MRLAGSWSDTLMGESSELEGGGCYKNFDSIHPPEKVKEISLITEVVGDVNCGFQAEAVSMAETHLLG
ncbi:hypothetical protein VP01_3180g5 [Puccinia sorghi]|uniref:Uncharacterized protein n=1 Tax=Puccinia sorghi TaxID=27349 RepID=A0A0L6UYS7_9BASI|nr:hypothetical protein VP01_3180g5 [Puccinia sorghi]